MDLVDIRKSSKLTQKQAALLIGIPYRTYIRYEECPSYIGSFKYQKIVEDLASKVRVDENHGLLSLDSIKETVLPILKKHNINYCYLFGSYARGEAKESSDVDLLLNTEISGIAFFKLVDELRESLHKKVDVLRLQDIKSDNPIALEILKEGIKLK